MSGGSHNYLCYAEMPDIIGRTAETEEDVKRLCHYTNLQLLKPADNMKKSAKMPLLTK